MQGRKTHQEKLFISFQLSDYVPSDNFYRRLNELLDLHFLYAKTKKYYGNEGQKSIDPVIFIKLMLVGYFENLNSDRRIINVSRMRLDILYFLGYELDEELPWHSTLSRTRILFGENLFNDLFKVVLKQCIDKGMLSGRRQAIDSALIKANASMDTLIEREVMADAGVYADELNANIDAEIIRSINPASEKPSVKQRVGKSNAIRNGLKRSNKTHYSPADPDARIATKPGKPCRMNYLAQTSVDTASHVITHIQAFHADKGDAQCFPEQLKATVANLEANGLTIDEVLADGGYSSMSNFEILKELNITGYIPLKNTNRNSTSGFVFDKINDRYTCPNGVYLTFRGTRIYSENCQARLYKSSVKDCKQCPLRETCVNSRGYRLIEGVGDPELYSQMEQRLQTRRGKLMKGIRSGSVEPVFGALINYTGLRQINARGIKQANKCMLMAAIAHNLKKLLKFQPVEPLPNIHMVPIGRKAVIGMETHFIELYIPQDVKEQQLRKIPAHYFMNYLN